MLAAFGKLVCLLDTLWSYAGKKIPENILPFSLLRVLQSSFTFNGNIANWDVSAVNDMSWMFHRSSFTENRWERGFQAMQLRSLWGQQVWAVVFLAVSSGSVLFQLHELTRPSVLSDEITCAFVCSKCLLYFFSADSMVRAWLSWKQHDSDRDTVVKTKLSLRLFSLAVAFEINFDTNHEIRVMDLAMRWIACCSHCFPEFEETAGWFFVVLGWRPTRLLFLTSENQRASVVDGTLFFVWIIGCGIMGWITSSRRTEYIRGVATSTICDPSQPYVLRVSSSELDHDGYFTKEEWAELEPMVQAEGEEIMRRRVCETRRVRDRGPTQYEWIHSSKIIGQGTYGSVEIVKSRVTHEMCAMKRVFHSKAHEKIKDNTEGRLLQALRHPHITSCVDEIQTEFETQTVMELCSLGSLQDLIKAFGPLDAASCRWFTSNMVSALAYLHRHGIAHEDFKPGNCFLARGSGGEGAVLKVGDFGSSTFKRSDRGGGIRGTPLYSAPEKLKRGQEERRGGHGTIVSRRKMDIWSLGVCVAEMATGSTVCLLPLEHTQSLSGVKAFLCSLARDPPLRDLSGHDPLATAFIRACLRIQPSDRANTLALAAHPFLAAAQTCPLAAPAVTALQHKTSLLWADIAPLSEPAWLLPKLRRRAWFWLSPPFVWQWLVELEGPFLSPEMEERFFKATVRDKVAWAKPWLSFVGALMQLVTLGRIAHNLSTDTPDWSRVHKQLICCSWTAGVMLSSTESIVRNYPTWVWISRLFYVCGILMKPLSILFAPISAPAIYLITSCFIQQVPEAICVVVCYTLTASYWRVVDLRRELQHQGSSSVWLWDSWLLSVLFIQCVPCLITCHFILWRRRQERIGFRQLQQPMQNSNPQGVARGPSATQSPPSPQVT